MHFFLTSAILLIFIGLSGCEGKYFSSNKKITNYAIVKNYKGRQKKSFSKTKAVIVEKGDSVYSIAKSNGIAIRDLILRNGLVAPYKILVGQKLIIPIPDYHTVFTGDTVFAVSRKYNVDMRTLVELNNLKPPYQLKRGQTLKIPNSSIGKTKPGEKNLRTVFSAQEAFVFSPFPKPRPSERTHLEKKRTRKNNIFLPKPSGRGGKYFLWPVRGTIISRFGPRRGGLHNDGINIAAPRGAPVFASENGVVAYAGNGIKGFGNLLLVRHSDGWTTAYAHIDKVLVKKGDTVKRGETIGTIGSSGKVNRPQLHFEIRKGSQAIDPMTELAA
jgi:murein DD-endopeptidase MepM/ murein hydrolase activator NlpD